MVAEPVKENPRTWKGTGAIVLHLTAWEQECKIVFLTTSGEV